MNDAAIRYFRRREAHSKVACALKKGVLIKQPCWCCGNAKVEAHHYDYDRPLDVVWLCKEHHYQLHTEHTYPQKLPTGSLPVEKSVGNFPLDRNFLPTELYTTCAQDIHILPTG